jgi:acyl carrier protein
MYHAGTHLASHGCRTSENDRILLYMRTATEIETEVLEVLRQVSGRSVDIRRTDELGADLGFDSLKTLELVAALEDHFDVSIPLNDLPSVRSVAQVVDHMNTLLSGQRKVDGEVPDPSRGSRIGGGPE